MQALGNLASILEREAPSEEAFRMYEEALKRAEKYGGNDSVAIAHANLAGAHSRKGDLEEAVSHYREAVGICRSEKMGLYLIDFLLELGSTLAEAGRIDAARDILDEINEAEPASDYAVAIGHIRGAVLWRAGRKEEAIQVLKSVLPRADSILERFDVLYELFRALGTRESAEQALEAGIVLQQDNPHWETGSKIEILRATLKD
jgi:tetratricopeptide (TPR) repeat protein